MNKIKLSFLTFFIALIIPSFAFADTASCTECLNRTGSTSQCASACSTGGSTGSSPIFGKIPLPAPLANFGDVNEGGIGNFLNIIFKTIVVASGVYALINLLVGGYSFMGAADDPKKVAGAWARIWQTFLGLAVTAGAFVLAAIFGQIIFGDPTFILNPDIPTL